MKSLLKMLALMMTAVMMTATGAMAQDKAATAQSLVDKAIAHYDAAGQDKSFADFNDKAGEFVFDEYYVIVADGEKGTFLTHAINPKLINNPQIWDLQDVNSNFIIRDMVEVGKANAAGGWSNYTWTHPETKKLAEKKTWVKPHDGKIFMVGYYE
ncbi:cache domain-containing protein [Thalassospira sp.]|uniref:cache domain-containing protein n=1 Tax=Thalassospira sp. TaxID=1912094 RepID=UPI0027331100|nr:cache domain-containing protein [Thalassospira sp.]MDP2697125.1 cache domain-containing protein [Thalassospira sp.]